MTFYDLLEHRKEKGSNDDLLLSVSQESGVVPQEEAGRREVASINRDNYWRVYPGDLVYNTMRMWQGASAVSQNLGIVSPAYTVCRPREGVVPEYIGYLAKLPEMIRAFTRLSQGITSDVWNLKYRHFSSIAVPNITQSEQQRITVILGMVDRAIRETGALIAKHEMIKAGMMHDLFTRGVLPTGELRPPPAEAPDLYEQTALGPMPNTWDVLKLGAILRKHGGYLQTGPFGSQLHAREYVQEGIPVVMPQNITEGFVDRDSIAQISQSRADDLRRHWLANGDVVIARRGELSRASAVTAREVGWLCGTGCFLLRLGTSSLGAPYAATLYRQDLIQRQIAGLAVGTTMPSLNNSVMSKLLFPYCNADEQTEIMRRVDCSMSTTMSLKQNRSKLQNLKHGLMASLLSLP